MEKVDEVINKLKELFITVRFKYIRQYDNGSYRTFNTYKNSNHVMFYDGLLMSHIKRSKTYGIFCRSEYTKFITFDVDMETELDAKKTVLALHEVLNDIGVPSSRIFTSISGLKGYHVDLYFSEEINYSLIETLYKIVTLEVDLLIDGSVQGNIELRPSSTQGVKLPLSIHRKSKRVCWYVDVFNNFKPIKDMGYICKIKQIDAEIIKSIVNDLSIDLNPDEQNSAEIMPKLTEIDFSNETLESLKNLYEKGLTKSGTRNFSLCKLAIYFNTLGEHKINCEDRLVQWMKKQDTKYYKTDLDICLKEIKRIVNSVYKKNVVLFEGRSSFEVTKSELLTIRQYENKYNKTLDALFLHWKRFKDKNNQFFMTYEQIAKAANYSVRTAFYHIKELERENVIKIIRSPIYFSEDGNPNNQPNTYELNLNWLTAKDEKKMTVNLTDLHKYRSTNTNIIKGLFPNDEWIYLSDQLKQALENQKN